MRHTCGFIFVFAGSDLLQRMGVLLRHSERICTQLQLDSDPADSHWDRDRRNIASVSANDMVGDGEWGVGGMEGWWLGWKGSGIVQNEGNVEREERGRGGRVECISGSGGCGKCEERCSG